MNPNPWACFTDMTNTRIVLQLLLLVSQLVSERAFGRLYSLYAQYAFLQVRNAHIILWKRRKTLWHLNLFFCAVLFMILVSFIKDVYALNFSSYQMFLQSNTVEILPQLLWVTQKSPSLCFSFEKTKSSWVLWDLTSRLTCLIKAIQILQSLSSFVKAWPTKGLSKVTKAPSNFKVFAISISLLPLSWAQSDLRQLTGHERLPLGWSILVAVDILPLLSSSLSHSWELQLVMIINCL